MRERALTAFLLTLAELMELCPDLVVEADYAQLERIKELVKDVILEDYE